MAYISKELTLQEMCFWQQGDVITIHAGTGAGKSHWVKNILYKKAKAEGKKILFLLHRVACIEQFRKELDKQGKSDTITLQTYQHYDHHIDEGYITDIGFDGYIVCDECHYFISDAGFNERTDKAKSRILKNDRAIRIFMSATSDWIDAHFESMGVLTQRYKFEPDYSFIRSLTFYEDKHSISKIINNSKGKVLAFINKTSEAYALSNELEDTLFCCGRRNEFSQFIDEDKIDTLLSTGKLPCKTLLTTTALDTGLNLVDKKLKTILLYNVTELAVIKQCIGRRRHGSVDVFIHDPHPNTHYRRAKNNEDIGKMIEKIEAGDTEEDLEQAGTEQEYFIYKFMDNLSYEEEHLKKFNVNFKLRQKLLAQEYDLYIEQGYKEILGKEFDVDYAMYEEEIKEEAIIEFMKSNLDVPLVDEKKLQLIRLLDVRGSNNRMRTTRNPLNNWIEVMNIPYWIDQRQMQSIEEGVSGRRRYWIIKEHQVEKEEVEFMTEDEAVSDYGFDELELFGAYMDGLEKFRK